MLVSVNDSEGRGVVRRAGAWNLNKHNTNTPRTKIAKRGPPAAKRPPRSTALAASKCRLP